MTNGFNDREHNLLWEAIRDLKNALDKLEDSLTNDLIHRMNRQHKWVLAMGGAILTVLTALVVKALS